jgi:hypothetical protein
VLQVARRALGAIEEEDLGTSLRAACEAGDLELVRELLVRGANVDALMPASKNERLGVHLAGGLAPHAPALAQGSSGSGVLGAMDDGQAAEQAQGGGLRSAAAGVLGAMEEYVPAPGSSAHLMSSRAALEGRIEYFGPKLVSNGSPLTLPHQPQH